MKKLILSAFLGSILSLGAFAAVDMFPDTWVCVDALGRNVASSDSGVTRSNINTATQIGIFYYLWQGQHGDEIKDNTKLITENPDNPAFGGETQFHWGGEPALGYYAGGDAFVVAKHMQMLVDAGIDFYFFDVTNGFTYDNNVLVVMKEIDRRVALGLKAPKLAFLCRASTVNVVTHLYDTYYSNSQYDKYWYNWDGKPLIFANKNSFATLSSTIRNRFTMRDSWAWTSADEENEWSWLQYYPQAVGWTYDSNNFKVTEQISVGAAQHATTKVGKSYHNGFQPTYDKYGLCSETPYGLYFQEQWNKAINSRPQPPVVMITQWNEWIAQRFIISSADQYGDVRPGATAKIGESYFVDVYNQEFSRDLEPSKEPLILDNYYLQLVSNVRRYRGVNTIPLPTVSKTIKLNGDFSQWEDVTPEYLDEPGDCYYKSSTAQAAETLSSQANDIVKSKVTKDVDSLYFYAKTDSVALVPLSPNTTLRWMTLLLNSDCNYSTGWNGYDYMISNRRLKMLLYRYDSSTSTWVIVKAVNYSTAANEFMLSLSKADVGLTGEKDFDFKWIDNIPKTSTNILDFISEGEAAPDGRFNYRYKGAQLPSSGINGIIVDNSQFTVKSTVGSDEATFNFNVPVTGNVNITVYNTLGQQVATINRHNVESGNHDETCRMGGGVYVVKYDIAGSRGMRKFVK
jgi:hypothetical protein